MSRRVRVRRVYFGTIQYKGPVLYLLLLLPEQEKAVWRPEGIPIMFPLPTLWLDGTLGSN